jgi:hypothetical protein
MNIEEAKLNVGKMVMSRDPGNKMIKYVEVPHGPYLLKQITKGSLAILEGRKQPVQPSLLSEPTESKTTVTRDKSRENALYEKYKIKWNTPENSTEK